MSYFKDIYEVKPVEITPGITIRTLWGDNVMMSVVEKNSNFGELPYLRSIWTGFKRVDIIARPRRDY